MEDLPEGRNPVGCKWVYNIKRDRHGNVIRYKVRLVAQGFSQKPGTDYSNDGTFALLWTISQACTRVRY